MTAKTINVSVPLEELMTQARWCCWRREARQDAKGIMQPTKVPYTANRRRAKSNDPATWDVYQTVKAALDGDPDFFAGVGLFFNDTLCGIDIDAHDGPNALADEVLDLFKGTYIERSPSGTGYHILFLAQSDPALMKDRFYQKNPHNGLEFYAGEVTNRFFTFTNKCVSEADAVTDQTEQLSIFLDKYMRRKSSTKAAQQSRTRAGHGLQDGSGPDDQSSDTRACDDASAFDLNLIHERLDKARRAQNGNKFCALYDHGDTSQYGADDSAADQALCAMLAFWLDADAAAMDTAFRRSKLMRSKWDERRGAQTYGEMTIQKAIDTIPEGRVYGDELNPIVEYAYMPTVKGDLTDAGNAEKFAELYKRQLRYCSALGWLEWDGKVWRQDDHAAGRLALKFSENMLQEALTAYTDTVMQKANEQTAKAYLAHAKKTRSAAGIFHFMELAKARLAIPLAQLDSDPYLLNTDAGLIDLRTGECSKHNPHAYCTKITHFTPSKDGADVWRDFLKLITSWAEDQQEMLNYLQLVMGQSIIGNDGVGEENLRIMYGDGGNGKSTFFNAIRTVIGDYGTTTTPSLLIEDNKINKENYMSQMVGRRLVTVGELEEGQRLSLSQLKRIASTDTVTVRLMRQNPEVVKPSWHIFLHTNFLPRVGSSDTGTWRRLTVVPFMAKMPKGEGKVLNYDQELVKRAGGAILQWLIDGATACVAVGGKITTPKDVKRATDAYREREDLLQQFLLARCTIDDKSAVCSKAELYREYKQFTAQNNAFTMKSVDFEEAVRRHGFSTTKVHGTIMFHGVKVNNELANADGALEWDDTIYS